MALKHPRFITGRDSQNGLAGYLAKLVEVYGTATVLSGQTSIVVPDTGAATGDLIFTSIQTKGANACHVVGVTISNGVSFTITVNTDPGSGGCVIAYVRLNSNVFTP